ncbi:type I restriction enzyme R subunit [Methanococcus voltae]|uniref:type I site-specific deoxyribonuclease n=1 Tax=Methanococcus voltae TaxID=2188 RepID=A0A8J7RN91_METVO|nr:type I restriction endonuclease subunit R [Methanococcus voltae]MBP2202011.1 type I restriction enzyme R subunit [Methanococcus voltae]
MSYKENNWENAVIELFCNLGYNHYSGYKINRDTHKPYYEDMLRESLESINSNLPQEAIEEAIYKITNYDTNKLLEVNEIFTEYMQNGVTVAYRHDGENKNDIVKLIDYENVDKNNFCVINQWTIEEYDKRRPDVIVFINGLPLVVIELKSCSREETDVSEAYNQLRNYMHDIPSLFNYNAFCVISDLAVSKAGTITSDEERFMEWKTIDGTYESKKAVDFKTLFYGMFEKNRLLDIIKDYVLYLHDTDNNKKILAGYHQYFAVKKALLRTEEAVNKGDGKCGIFWHTQGSGKSLSMVFYTKILQQYLNHPTVVVITDRTDLDEQLYGTFSKSKKYLRQTPQKAKSRADLKELLDGRVSNGIIFTTIQKFEESEEPLSNRNDIILIADEAHRSQYGLSEKIDAKTGKIKSGYARLIRNSLPNAGFIGFTGTPISTKDRDTIEVFGDYIDIYDMTQAVEDGATRPIFYENRVVKLNLDEATLKKLDIEYTKLEQVSDDYSVEKSKQENATIKTIMGAEETVNTLCNDIINHYEDRKDLLTGKAMVVAYSRDIAIKMYKKFLEIRPEWTDKLKVVITGDNKDPEEWKELTGTKAYREELSKEFKNDESDLKIVIVVDMWLTGFDLPSLATMYMCKQMRGHDLIQAIARVNRVYKNKEGGLVVDYAGIASHLKIAMHDFTSRDRKNYQNNDISKTALPKFLDLLDICRDEFFYKFNYRKFLTGSDLERAEIIAEGINHILENEEKSKEYIKQSTLLKQANSLCRSLITEEQRLEYAFFSAVRVGVIKLTNKKTETIKTINENIAELLKQSIKSEGVINIFGENTVEISIFDEKFLKEVSNMKHKNISAELLKKLLSEKVRAYQKTNLVKSELFSTKLQRIMNLYRNKQITNVEVIEQLLQLAKEIKEDSLNGEKLGLSLDEKAFYDALTKPEAVKDFYKNEELINITKELTEKLNENKTIDWYKKETARGSMRKMVKRLLKKYKYPPEEMDYAINTVISQCEFWADNQYK